MKQMGTGTQLYIGDTDDVYGQAYYYKDDAGDVNGYVHWSSTHYPYIKNAQMFVAGRPLRRARPPPTSRA